MAIHFFIGLQHWISDPARDGVIMLWGLFAAAYMVVTCERDLHNSYSLRALIAWTLLLMLGTSDIFGRRLH